MHLLSHNSSIYELLSATHPLVKAIEGPATFAIAIESSTGASK
jgi:hypothetical protein